MPVVYAILNCKPFNKLRMPILYVSECTRVYFLVLQKPLNSESGRLRRKQIFCLKEIALPKTVDFGGNRFKTRLLRGSSRFCFSFAVIYHQKENRREV